MPDQGATGGVITPRSALVTGYDFVADAAQATAVELQAGIGSNYIADTLIQPGRKAPDDPSAWHASDLRAKLLGSVRHDVAVLSGHFSSGSLLAADYATSMASAEISASTANLNNMLVYILGCHGGYTIPLEDELAGASPDPDWVKAFLRKGAAGLVASTGYAYGDTELVEYGGASSSISPSNYELGLSILPCQLARLWLRRRRHTYRDWRHLWASTKKRWSR